jgi:MinD superfamily P-loop ATPase
MKEIVIISGKGGTGKTSITAAITALKADKCVAADCDVDAADMHLLLDPDFANETEFFSGYLAHINQDKCTKCGKCKRICQFNAIELNNNEFSVNELDCEGCGYCANVCPVTAIKMSDALVGHYYTSKTRFNNTLVHAKLDIGADNSGKLVTKVKETAREQAKNQQKPYLIIDGTPGIGCTVTASLTGADHTVIVTEPTISAFWDMKRVIEVAKQLNITTSCIINKADLNNQITNDIKQFLAENNIPLIGKIGYINGFTDALKNKQTIVETDKDIEALINGIWEKSFK